MADDEYPWMQYGRDRSVRHSKQDALSEIEFERLVDGAKNVREYYGLQAVTAVLVLGILGLRRGELAHFCEGWINWRNQMIEIPSHQECHGERGGNGLCGYCEQLAQGRARRNDDLSLEKARSFQWRPKTKAAVREVYFGFSPRTELYLERFTDDWDEWVWSAQAINRRIDLAAEQADGLNVDDIYPHALRSTAATRAAERGLEALSLLQLFGWVKLSTAEVYLARSGKNTAKQLDQSR